MKYSIIIPVYKVERYLKECLDSVVNQTYKNIEIILVDDGSPDSCGDICDTYSLEDERVKVIHKPNGGLVSARKAGVRIATGEYICCVDGDDYIEATYIEEFHTIVEKYGVDIVCCGYKKLSPSRVTFEHVNAQEGYYDRNKLEQKIFPFLINGTRGEYFLPTLWGKAIKKELYLKYQLPLSDEVTMGEDGAVTIPCIAHANSMFVSPLCNYYYRYNPTSMTKGRGMFGFSGQLEIAEHLKKNLRLEIYDFYEQYNRKIMKGFYIVAISKFNAEQPFEDIRREIEYYLESPVFENILKNVRYRRLGLDWIMFKACKHRKIIFFKMLNRIKSIGKRR